jgi:hypothetical protein
MALIYLKFFLLGGKAAVINVLNSHKITRLRQHQLHSKNVEVRHISGFSFSAIINSTDGFIGIVFAF